MRILRESARVLSKRGFIPPSETPKKDAKKRGPPRLKRCRCQPYQEKEIVEYYIDKFMENYNVHYLPWRVWYFLTCYKFERLFKEYPAFYKTEDNAVWLLPNIINFCQTHNYKILCKENYIQILIDRSLKTVLIMYTIKGRLGEVSRKPLEKEQKELYEKHVKATLILKNRFSKK